MVGIGVACRELRQDRPRGISAARLIAVCIGAIDKRLIRERQLWSPIECRATCDGIPLLINDICRRIAPAIVEELAGNIGEMFLIFRPP